MNTVEKLIQEMCPEGVPFFFLEELFDLRNGYTPSKAKPDYWKDGSVPWFRMEDIRKKGKVLDDSIQKVSKLAVKGGRYFEANSLIIATTATIGEHALIQAPFLANQQFTILTIKSNFKTRYDAKFGFYIGFLLSRYCEENTNVSGFASVDMEKFRKFKFPLPPLVVQQEIVSILDKFTELESELEAEQEARSVQYESYRDALLDFRTENTTHPLKCNFGASTFEEVEWVTIGTLGELFTGLSGKSREDFSNGNSPFVSYLDIGNHASLPRQIANKVAVDVGERQNEIKIGDILFTGSSEDIVGVGLTSEVEYEPNEKTYLNSFCFGLRPESDRFAKGFLKHLFRSSGIRQKIIACGNGVTRINISKKLLLKVEIPQPSLVLQEAIVSILDKMGEIVTGTQASLPAEIQARHKQYEYYRDKLLTFKELDAA